MTQVNAAKRFHLDPTCHNIIPESAARQQTHAGFVESAKRGCKRDCTIPWEKHLEETE